MLSGSTIPNVAPGCAAHGSANAAPTLRHYQQGSLLGVARELAVHRSTLVVAATGTGKTVTFAELARTETQRGGRVLVVVNRDELVKQARRKCEAIGLYPDVEKAEQRANTLAKLVIASVQTLKGKRLLRWARSHFTLIIVDECHHAVATSYGNVLDHFADAKVVGFTATPDRADGKGLGEVFASVAYRYEIREAIREGFLVPIIARRIVVDSIDLSAVSMRAGDFAQDQLADVMANERALRGQAVPLLEQARDRLSIAFCVNVAHAHALAATLNSLRPGCARGVSGETDDDEREEILAAHARGDFQFLCNCDVLVEGYDCPEVSCVAMCRPTRSWARFVQCGGRGLRPAPWANKRDCLILVLGDGKTPGLIGPADCLTGRGQIPDDVRAEIERLIGNAQLAIESVVEQAEDECAKRREQIRLSAVVKYHAENVDPFIGEDAGGYAAARAEWRGEPPSEKQLEALEKMGVTTSKLPSNFTRSDAWNLLSRIHARTERGLCSYKAAKRLAGAGVRDTKNLGKERAKELLDLLRLGDWRPRAIANEPECQDEKRGAA